MFTNQKKLRDELDVYFQRKDFDLNFNYLFKKLKINEENIIYLFSPFEGDVSRLEMLALKPSTFDFETLPAVGIVEKLSLGEEYLRLEKNFRVKAMRIGASKFLTESHISEVVKWLSALSTKHNFTLKQIETFLPEEHFLLHSLFRGFRKRSHLSENNFNEILNVNPYSFQYPGKLTPKQFYKIIENDLALNLNVIVNAQISETSNYVGIHKPKLKEIDVTQNWDVLKQSFVFEKPIWKSKLQTLLKTEDIDFETFSALADNWPSSLEDLLQACAFNGPDK